MCCFSRPVEHVGQTQIFARTTAKGRQLIVYSMQIDAKEDLAMILPIPVPEKTADDAVKFIDLEKYPELFGDLNRGFPVTKGEGFGGGGISPRIVADAPKPLAVVEVGSFQASFGGTPATVKFSGLTGGFLGLYQFNVVVPDVPASDTVPFTFSLDGTAGTQTLLISVTK